MYPTVNVLIPSYNQQNELVEAIESALRIDYPNLSVIVSDDNSPISIDWIIEKYKANPKVRIFKNNKNIGRVANYRKLLYELSDAEWLINLDGDDFFINSSFVTACFDFLNKSSNNKIAFFMGCMAICEKGELQKPRLFWSGKDTVKVYSGLDYVIKEFPVLDNFSHSAILYKKSLAMQSNFYSFNSLNTDAHSFLNMALKKVDIVLLNKPFVAWRKHGSNASKGFNYDYKLSKEYNAMIDISAKIEENFGQNKSSVFMHNIKKMFYRGEISTFLHERKFLPILKNLLVDRRLIFLKTSVLINITSALLVKKLKLKKHY